MIIFFAHSKIISKFVLLKYVTNGGSGVIPWQSYPKMIDKRYMKNGRSDTPCS